MNISFQSDVLTVDGVDTVLPYPIQEVLAIRDVVIVRVDSDLALSVGDKSLNRNVYAFDKIGKLIWQIEESPHGGAGRSKPYMAIKNENGNLYADNWIGVNYVVDLGNGKVKTHESGRPW